MERGWTVELLYKQCMWFTDSLRVLKCIRRFNPTDLNKLINFDSTYINTERKSWVQNRTAKAKHMHITIYVCVTHHVHICLNVLGWAQRNKPSLLFPPCKISTDTLTTAVLPCTTSSSHHRENSCQQYKSFRGQLLYTVVLEGYHPHRSTLNSICVEKKNVNYCQFQLKCGLWCCTRAGGESADAELGSSFLFTQWIY